MNKDRYSIIFNSKTGNTRKLADAIHEALPQENCDLFGAVERDVPASETLYIGFWTDKGSADKATAELLAKLKNRKIFLFGTAGFGGSEEYFTNILDNVKKLINEQYRGWGVYVPGQDAGLCKSTLCKNERAARSYAESGHADREL